MLPAENFFCSWTEILKGRIVYGHLCPPSFEELDSYALKTAALRRSQPLLDWFLLQKQSWTETCFFLCLLQVKWNLCRCCVHLVQVLLPKCCSDLFLLARNFLSKWICNMLQSCNSFDYYQDYIYLIKKFLYFLKSALKDIGLEIPAYGFSLFPHFSWFWVGRDIHLSLIFLTLINAWSCYFQDLLKWKHELFGGQLSVVSAGRFGEGRFASPQALCAQVLQGISSCRRQEHCRATFPEASEDV